jgi:hypothetical protein
MAPKKSWREKLGDDQGLPKVGKITGAMTAKWGRGTMVIPAPREVDALMRKVAKGKLVTIQQLRLALANKHGVSIACPITTGIFAWIAAHAAQESLDAGAKRVTPYWRTLKSGGELNAKYPGGIARLKALLNTEGHRVVQTGKRFFVADYEKALARL